MWVFTCAVDEGSFTDGARRAHISQPAAVNIIDEIEETVGEPLFERSGKTRRAILNARGKEVYDTFVRTLAVYERALESICSSKLQRRVQKILIQSPYVASVSALWLRNLIPHRADTQLCIHCAGWREIITAIENREDCMALIDGDIRPKNSEYFTIGNVEMVFIVPETNRHFNTDLREITWEDVPADTLIYSDICPLALERAYGNLKAAQNNANAFTEVNCSTLLKNFCRKAGVPAIVPKNLMEIDDNDIRFCCCSFAYSKIFIPLGISISHGNRMRGKILGRDIENVFDNRFYI
ncbi:MULTISPECIES: LysR family transcriptional regulator [Chelativorans]|jgi:DNA-binding transcriptional LysR family regulator|nr:MULTISPECIES: LysR family transcriptional regulator [Chelativorans]